jgi:hypothetical protein
VSITIQVEPAQTADWSVEYRWDRDTDILTASAKAPVSGDGVSGSVELTGSDGSWLILDLAAGSIKGVEVAVWPDVRAVPSLGAPDEVEDGRLTVPAEAATGRVASIEVATSLLAEADGAERTIHFRVGGSKPSRTVRIARDILIDVDAQNAIAGVWLLNVPPFPDEP